MTKDTISLLPYENCDEIFSKKREGLDQCEFYHQIIGASVIGPLHVLNGTPCQDACSFEAFTSGFAAIAVADGLGSSIKSEIGADIAVEESLNSVRRYVNNMGNSDVELCDIAKEAVYSARNALEEKARELECKLRDLACTLIVVVIHDQDVGIAQIGDGAVIGKTIEGLKLISGPGDSEYANEVSPLTSEEWEDSLRISSNISNVLGIMAFTDGCQRAALKKTQEGIIPFGRFCEPLFSYAETITSKEEGERDLRDLLSSKKVCNNSEDDKTLVIAIFKTGNGEKEANI